MKILQINTFSYKSTGHIMMNIHALLTEKGYDSYVCWGRGRNPVNNKEIVLKDRMGVFFHGLYTRVFDKTGFASKRATQKLIKIIDEIKPDIIHLHNLHGYYLNIELLFDYIKRKNIRVIWTLHDCWAVTGHCAGFDMCGCDKWKSGCYACDQRTEYPASRFVDNSKQNWLKKKMLFSGLDMTIVTPSNWLCDIVKQSYLNKYSCKIINNGIDLSIFKPSNANEIKKVKSKYEIDDREIVLGVASEWTIKKGLKDFLIIAEMMKNIQFVLVGLNEKQLKNLPDCIKGIKRTENQQELATLYTMARVFFNPTYEDNFPTTNIEALACGTAVITYNTGGSPEVIKSHVKESVYYIGDVIEKETSSSVSYEKVMQKIAFALDRVNENEKECSQACVNVAKYYDASSQFEKYIKLYMGDSDAIKQNSEGNENK